MRTLTAGAIALIVTGYDEAATVDPDAWNKLMEQDFTALEARVAAHVGCPEPTDARVRRSKGERKRNKRDRWA